MAKELIKILRGTNTSSLDSKFTRIGKDPWGNVYYIHDLPTSCSACDYFISEDRCFGNCAVKHLEIVTAEPLIICDKFDNESQKKIKEICRKYFNYGY